MASHMASISKTSNIIWTGITDHLSSNRNHKGRAELIPFFPCCLNLSKPKLAALTILITYPTDAAIAQSHFVHDCHLLDAFFSAAEQPIVALIYLLKAISAHRLLQDSVVTNIMNDILLFRNVLTFETRKQTIACATGKLSEFFCWKTKDKKKTNQDLEPYLNFQKWAGFLSRRIESILDFISVSYRSA